MAIGRTQCPQPRRPPACRRRRHEIEEAHVEPPGSEALVRNDPDRARRCRRRRARRHLGRPERPGHRPELLPAGSGDDPGPGDPRSLHDRLHHRGRDLLRRRGADRLDGHPLPAQARRRRAAAPDPRPQPRRGRLDGRPDADRHLPVLHLVADAEHRRGQVERTRPARPGPRRPVPVDVRLHGARREGDRRPGVLGVDAVRARRRPVPAGGQDDPLLPDEQRRHPRVLRPGVPLQARRRPGPCQRVRPVGRGELGRPGDPRPVRRAVRHRPRRHAVRRQHQVAGRVPDVVRPEGRRGQGVAPAAAQR